MVFAHIAMHWCNNKQISNTQINFININLSLPWENIIGLILIHFVTKKQIDEKIKQIFLIY